MLRKAIRLFRRVWYRLPLDGSGVFSWGPWPGRIFGKVAARDFWRRTAPSGRWVLLPMARCIWLVACPVLAVQQGFRRQAPLRDICAAVWLGWTSGKPPACALLHRALAGEHKNRLAVADSIPGDRTGVLLLAAVGSSADMKLASDKFAMASQILALGLPGPRTLAVLQRGEVPDLTTPVWTSGKALLVKPCHGGAARGIFTVFYAGGQQFVVKGHTSVSSQELAQRLMAAASRDTVLVQEWIGPAPEMEDLSPCAAPVFRVFVLRPAPGEAPYVVSAMLKVLPPGLDAPQGVDELLLMPVNPETGVLDDGILLSQPAVRWQYSPWGGGPIRGRWLRQWTETREMAEAASQLLPGTPLIGWDILLGPAGPVILEANTGISVFRSMLRHFEQGTTSPVPVSLLRWCLSRSRRSHHA